MLLPKTNIDRQFDIFILDGHNIANSISRLVYIVNVDIIAPMCPI